MEYNTSPVIVPTVWTKSNSRTSETRTKRFFDRQDKKDFILAFNQKWVNDEIPANSVLVTKHKVSVVKAEVPEASSDIDVEIW